MSQPGNQKSRSVAYEPYEGTSAGDDQSAHSVRAWLRRINEIGQLKVVTGVDWQESIGRVTEMLHHTDDSPAVIFDEIPGFESGNRILVNSLATRPRLAITLGLDPTIDTFSLMDEWERLINETDPVPLEPVSSAPIGENVLEGDDVDLFAFPTPLWHPEDGGRYIGTGCGVITKARDSSWIDRAYPVDWGGSYPAYGQMTVQR